MSVPTTGETFAKLLHHLREAQDCAATLAHLHNTEEHSIKDIALARGWLSVSEFFKMVQHRVTELAKGHYN